MSGRNEPPHVPFHNAPQARYLLTRFSSLSNPLALSVAHLLVLSQAEVDCRATLGKHCASPFHDQRALKPFDHMQTRGRTRHRHAESLLPQLGQPLLAQIPHEPGHPSAPQQP